MSQDACQSNLREKVISLYREYRAIMILTSSLNSSGRNRVDAELRSLEHASRQQLREYRPKIERILKDTAKKFGVKASLEQMEKTINSLPPEKPDQTRFHLRVFQLDQMFDHYDRVVRDYRKFPPHAMISIDIGGTQEKKEAYWYILEQVFYIGMALHWNDAFDAWHSDGQPRNRIGYALLHSTVRAAFALIEAYINNLALDVLVTRTDLCQKDIEILNEWNSNDDRAQYVSFRKKLLTYPRIALAREHPILNEDNCDEIKTVLESKEKYRDTVTHPTSRLTPAEMRDGLRSREHHLWALDLSATREICDSVVALIFKIDDVLNGKFGRVEIWLQPRGEDEYFPKDKLK